MTEITDSSTLEESLAADPSYAVAIKAIDAGSNAWVPIKQAAALLGLSVRQVRRYQAEGKMPPRKKIARELRYPRAAIEAMASGEPTPE